MPPSRSSAVGALIAWVLRVVVFVALWFASIIIVSGTGHLAGAVEVTLLAVLVAGVMVADHVLRRHHSARGKVPR